MTFSIFRRRKVHMQTLGSDPKNPKKLKNLITLIILRILLSLTTLKSLIYVAPLFHSTRTRHVCLLTPIPYILTLNTYNCILNISLCRRQESEVACTALNIEHELLAVGYSNGLVKIYRTHLQEVLVQFQLGSSVSVSI